MLPLVILSCLSFANLVFGSQERNSKPLWKNIIAREEPTCSCSDSPSTRFQTTQSFSDASSDATEPDGYVNSFIGGKSWPTGAGWLGHTEIDEYNNTICAAICDQWDACSSFAICKFCKGV
jgi:hypothetical protein